MSILLSDKHKTDPNRILKARKNETKRSAKNSMEKLYVLKITNVNRINPYLKNLLLNSQLTQLLFRIIRLSNEYFY